MNQHRRFFSLAVLLIISVVIQTYGQSAPVVSGNAYSTRWFLNLFSVIALAVMGLYNCVIFIMRSKDRAPLYFGLFCVCIAINNFVSSTGISFLTDLFPTAARHQLRKLDVATIVLSIPCFVMFMQAFYPDRKAVLFKRLFLWLAAVFLAAIVVTSGQSLEWVFCSYFPVILSSIVYVVITTIRAMVSKQHDAHGILTGIIIMSAAGVNDVLWGYGMLKTDVIIPYATLIFAVIYSALISRRFAHALISAERLNVELLENQRLRTEMQQRIAAEQDLRQAQRRLTAMLHTVDSPLCASNSTGTIVFCNRAFEELTGHPLRELIGKDPSLFDLAGNVSTIMPLELEDEQLNVHLYGPPGGEIASNRSSVAFIEELNKNRARIRSLEELLAGTTSETMQSNHDLRHDLEMIDTALEQMSTLLIPDSTIEQRKRLGVEVLSVSIAYWIECMNTGKFDLAEESGLWKVQINPDGWKRTQTLDRYLDYKTFPRNPRWNQIVKTADFVLIRCQSVSEKRNQLETLLQKLCFLIQ